MSAILRVVMATCSTTPAAGVPFAVHGKDCDAPFIPARDDV